MVFNNGRHDGSLMNSEMNIILWMRRPFCQNKGALLNEPITILWLVLDPTAIHFHISILAGRKLECGTYYIFWGYFAFEISKQFLTIVIQKHERNNDNRIGAKKVHDAIIKCIILIWKQSYLVEKLKEHMRNCEQVLELGKTKTFCASSGLKVY